MLWPNSSFQ